MMSVKVFHMNSLLTIQGRRLGFGRYVLELTHTVNNSEILTDEGILDPVDARNFNLTCQTVTISSLARSSVYLRLTKNPVFNIDNIPMSHLQSVRLFDETGKEVVEMSQFDNHGFIKSLDLIVFTKPTIIFQLQEGYFLDNEFIQQANISHYTGAEFPISLEMKKHLKSMIDVHLKVVKDFELNAANIDRLGTNARNLNWRRVRLQKLDIEIGMKRKQLQQFTREVDVLKTAVQFTKSSIANIELKQAQSTQSQIVSSRQIENLENTVKRLQSERILAIQEIFPIEKSCIREIFVPDSVFTKIDKVIESN